MQNNQESEPELPDELESTEQSNADLESADEADSTSKEDSSNQGRRYRRFRKFAFPVVLILGMVSALVWFAVYQAQQVPEFYASVLKLDESKAKIQGQMFERNLLRLQNASRRPRPWKVEFNQDQANGWFCSDLPEKFPESIPKSISDPRVVFTNEEIKIGFKYSFRGASGYVVLDADVFCTDKPNEIAIKVRNARTGFVPLPIGPWMERVADSIRNAGIPVFWSRNSGTPIAIFTLPDSLTSNSAKQVSVESISLSSEKLIIAGKTTKVDLPPEKKSEE